MAVAMRNVVTGKSVVIEGPSRRAFVGPPVLGPDYAAWFQDSNANGAGSIMKVKLGRSRPTVLVAEDSELSPVWSGGRLTGVASGPALSAGPDFIAYTDERSLAARFLTPETVPGPEAGRDVWLVAVGGGTPRRVTDARGDQGYPAMGVGDLVLWLDGRAGRTDLMTNR